MIRIQIFRFSLFLLFPIMVQGQLTEGSKIGVNTGDGLNAGRAGVFWNSPSSNSGIIGNFYVDSLWHEGDIKFTKVIPNPAGQSSDSLIGVPIRYNVFKDELEVLADKGKNDIRVVQGSNIKYFAVKFPGNSWVFENVKSFKSDKELSGFFETLVVGKLALMKHYRAKTVKPNYNPGFGVGEKNTTVSVTSDYYVVSNGAAEKINLSKKTVLSLMKGQEEKVNDYLKSNEVDFKREDDVTALFDFYNK